MRPSDRPGRQPLDADDIRALDQALIAAYTMHAELRARYPVAGYISRPGIPAQLSESLVAVAAPVLFGEGARAEYGGIKADLRLRWPDG
jgi:hypothetical protein